MTVGNARRTPPGTRRPHGDSAEVDIDAECIYGLHCDSSRSAPRTACSVRPSLTLLWGFTAERPRGQRKVSMRSKFVQYAHGRTHFVCRRRPAPQQSLPSRITGCDANIAAVLRPISVRSNRSPWPSARGPRTLSRVAHGLTEPGSCAVRCQAHCSDERNLGLGDCR